MRCEIWLGCRLPDYFIFIAEQGEYEVSDELYLRFENARAEYNDVQKLIKTLLDAHDQA